MTTGRINQVAIVLYINRMNKLKFYYYSNEFVIAINANKQKRKFFFFDNKVYSEENSAMSLATVWVCHRIEATTSPFKGNICFIDIRISPLVRFSRDIADKGQNHKLK